MWLRLVTPTFKKSPPITSRPSACNATEATDASGPVPAPGTNVRASSTPFVFKRATYERATPATCVKSPAMITLPTLAPVSNASARTTAFGPVPGLKVVSSEPLALSRATRLTFVPLKAVKPPAITILPSGWIASAVT